MAHANLVIFRFAEGDRWQPLFPREVPEWLKSDEAMTDLVAGAVLERDGEFYAAAKQDSPIIVPEKLVKRAN